MDSGNRYDVSPLGAGKNWVNKVGGLPLFARAIAHALMRDGHSESEAIQLAIGVMKNWAAGEGKVTPKTRAKAAAAIAQWEAMKAASHGSRATQSTGKSSSGKPLAGDHAPGHPFYGNQHTAANASAPPMSAADSATALELTPAQTFQAIANYQKANGLKVTGTGNAALLAKVKAGLGQHLKGVAIGSKPGKAPTSASGGSGGSKSAASKASTASKKLTTAATSASTKAQAASVALDKATASASSTAATEQARIATATTAGQTAIAAAQARVDAAKSDSAKAAAQANVTAVETAHAASIEAVEKSAQAAIAAANDRVVAAQTKANAAKTASTSANKAAGIRADSFGGVPVTESTSAGDLLPQGPVPQPPKPRQAKLAFDPTDSHAFRGKDLTHCAECGLPIAASVHSKKRASSGSRHAGHIHAPVPTGHVAGNVHRSRIAQKAAFNADADTIEAKFTDFAHKLFAQQQEATLSRLKGKRGRQMMNRANTTPPPPSDDEVQPTTNQVPPDASNIFDLAFWASKTADLAQPIYDAAGELSRSRVRGQVGQLGAVLPDASDEMGSLASVTSILQARANRMAQSVSQTTFDNIQGQLAQGASKGETLGQLTNRVKGVFADASRTRAQTIARTESIGALNESAHTYAAKLPQGIVGSHEWLAHHDDRTRATHRLADRQRQPLSQPFHVGASLMMFPGDPAAPADEVINCRCSQAFLPAVKALAHPLEVAA